VQISRWTILAVAVVAAGCNWFNRPIVYENDRETPPLEVPNDLIAPTQNPASNIPAVDGERVTSAKPPEMGDLPKTADTAKATEASLSFDDEVESVWARVGEALAQSACCQVLKRNESQATYIVAVGRGERPGFFKRLFGGDDRVEAIVKVARGDTGSSVTVVTEDGDMRRDDDALEVLGAIDAGMQ
jgi:uncharacterized lipoprotein